MLDREITPIGDASSSKRTKFLFGEEERTNGASSPFHIGGSCNSQASIVAPTVAVIPSHKRKTQNPEPSNALKKSRKDKFTPISDLVYSWVFGEITRRKMVSMFGSGGHSMSIPEPT